MGQDNLVPNPSFEENNGCPTNGNFEAVLHSWYKIAGSDYFHECGINGFGVPNNLGGGQNARTGQAYIGLGLWASSSALESQMVGIELTDSLAAGLSYKVEFYVSLMDSLWYAVRNAGAYFSKDMPPTNIQSLLNCTPQVRYDGDSYLGDKNVWMRISGSFIAQGGERHMTIGNFDGHSGSDALFVGGSQAPAGQPDYYKAAIYYLDDVSVMPDSITSVQDVTNTEPLYKLYPNPNTGAFTVEMNLKEGEVAQLLVWNLAGQQIHTQTLGNGINALKMDAAKGLYLYGITVNGATRWTGKIVVTSE